MLFAYLVFSQNTMLVNTIKTARIMGFTISRTAQNKLKKIIAIIISLLIISFWLGIVYG